MNVDVAKSFSALANETRLRCLYLVAANGEACVCEIVEALDITQPSASKALNTLKKVGLLSLRKDANWNYFSLDKSMPEWAAGVVEASMSGMASSKIHIADQKRFKRLDLRDANAACSPGLACAAG